MRRVLNFILPFALVLAVCSQADAARKKPSTQDEPQTAENGAPLVRAASVYVIDAKTGRVLYQKNSDQHRPPASTQKLLTALIIAEAGNLDQTVRVEQTDTEAEPVKLGFKPGEIYTRRDLLEVLDRKSVV